MALIQCVRKNATTFRLTTYQQNCGLWAFRLLLKFSEIVFEKLTR